MCRPAHGVRTGFALGFLALYPSRAQGSVWLFVLRRRPNSSRGAANTTPRALSIAEHMLAAARILLDHRELFAALAWKIGTPRDGGDASSIASALRKHAIAPLRTF